MTRTTWVLVLLAAAVLSSPAAAQSLPDSATTTALTRGATCSVANAAPAAGAEGITGPAPAGVFCPNGTTPTGCPTESRAAIAAGRA